MSRKQTSPAKAAMKRAVAEAFEEYMESAYAGRPMPETQLKQLHYTFFCGAASFFKILTEAFMADDKQAVTDAYDEMRVFLDDFVEGRV